MESIADQQIKMDNFIIESKQAKLKSQCQVQFQNIQIATFRMKNYQEKAIPLIFRNNQKKYEVNPQALQLFSSLQGKVAVISVAGIYRTGKSFLLNKIILNSSSGFAVGPTTNAKTKGIWVWSKPLISHNQNDEIINVIVLDSEGLGSTQEDINHDLKLFSITLLMSSAFLYNTVGSIDQNALDSLGLVLRLCEHLKSESYNDFPDFYWILRDFSLTLVDKDGKSLTTRQYLENCLSAQPGDSEIRNQIRSSIKQSFKHRSCFTFVRPLTDENSLQKLDKMELDELRPQFVQQVIDFRKLIFQSLKTKTIKGKQLKGEMLSDLISLYVDEINGDKIPVIETGWKYVCLKQCENALDDVERKLGQKLNQMTNQPPETKNQFLVKKQQVENQLLRIFAERTKNNDHKQESLEELKITIGKAFTKLEQQMTTKNIQQTKNFVRKEFQSVEKRFKSGQFTNIGQLSKQFEVFYQYFRKKCPYKDHYQVGLQYLLKKFADCSLILFKSMKTKKQNEITSLKQEVQKLTNSMIVKEEKFKSEKQKLNDRITISESSFSNLESQNKQSVLLLVEYENEIENLKSQIEEIKSSKQSEGEMEKITLKKKILLLQDELRQLNSSKGLQLSNFKNSMALKDNEIKHLLEQKKVIGEKLTQSLNLINKLNDEKSMSVDQLTVKIEETIKLKQLQTKEYEQKLRTRNAQISKLQNCLQSKANQLELLKSQKVSLSQESLEQFIHEKEQLKSKYDQQILSLKQTKKSLEDQYKLSFSKVQQDVQQKQMDLKMIKMQMEKQKAILEQKIDFLKRQVEQKDQKIAKLQKQNKIYLDMFEEKDNEITLLTTELDNFRMNHQNNSEEYHSKYSQFNELLKQKDKDIQFYQNTVEDLETKVRSIQSQYESVLQKHEKLNSNIHEITKSFKIKIHQLTNELDQQKQQYERQIVSLNQQNTKNLEEQKRNIELSIIQLKNYYEMEKERLQKKILEDRKRYESSQDEIVQEIEDKMKKQQRVHIQQINVLRNEIQSLEDQMSRIENEYQMRITTEQQEAEDERKMIMNKYEILEKKYNDSIEEFNSLENQTSQDRITFIKKIEMLNFELSKKQKELMQSNSKRENADNMLVKKQSQIDNIKKIMNQQIQNSLKKIQQTNSKYQKLNEQYLQFKIDSQKQLALCRQRNQFLNSKLAELNKEKQIGSSKNLENIDKLKIQDMKELIEKYKQQLIAYQSKFEVLRKELNQSQSTSRKQLAGLEKELEHQKQRLILEKTKNTDLQDKILNKNQIFKKELDEIKEKYQTQRNQHYKKIQQFKEKNSTLQDQKNNISWKLQKQVALLNDKIQYAERQKEQARKELQDSEKRLMILTNQLKKNSQKSNEDQESKKTNIDKRITQQLQTMKVSMKFRNDEQQEELRKLRDELKLFKQKNVQLQEKLFKVDKTKQSEKSLLEQKQSLKRQKQELEAIFKSEKTKQIEQWRKKVNEVQKTNKELMNSNNLYLFQIEKNESKYLMEKNSLIEKIDALENQLEWAKNTNQLQRNSSKSRLDYSKRSDLTKYSSSGLK